MKIVLENVNYITDDIYQTRMNASELVVLNRPCYNEGSYSIVIVEEKPDYDANRRILYLNPVRSIVLNMGQTEDVLIINSEEKNRIEKIKTITSGKSIGRAIEIGGDGLFLKSLPNGMLTLGRKLLCGVRNSFSGELKYFPKSNKFVETPKNFWSIKIQPRAKSFRITVKGDPGDFKNIKELKFKNDIRTFSSFILSDLEKVDSAVEAIIKGMERIK